MSSIDELEGFFSKRQALNKTIDLFIKKRSAILIAPTSYGKTLMSLRLFKIATNEKIAYRLIHVAPYRALVKEIFNKKFKKYLPFISGYQSHEDIGYEDKDPYFLRKLVVTTSDSFFYNLFKISVGEMHKVLRNLSHGHYNVVLASVLTSIVVFDEAHIYLNDTSQRAKSDLESLATVMASLKYLVDTNVPFIVESATVNSKTLKAVIDKVKIKNTPIIYVGSDQNKQVLSLKNNGLNVVAISDDLFNEQNSFNWYTEIVDEKEAIEKAIRYCNSEPILFINNTVVKAVKTYENLVDKCKEAVLIHGLLSKRDREYAIKKADELVARGAPGVIVSTQVIEAGVEVGYRILITDLAPVENIAQRAGRLCREGNKSYEICRDQGPHVYIIRPTNIEQESSPYSMEKLKETFNGIKHIREEEKQIDWRLLDSRMGFRSFTEILEATTPLEIPATTSIITDIYSMYLESEAKPSVLRELMNLLGVTGLIKQSMLISVLVNSIREVESIKDLDYVTTDLDRIIQYEDNKNPVERCLEYIDDRFKLIIVQREGNRIITRESTTRANLKNLSNKLRKGKFDIWSIIEEIQSDYSDIQGSVITSFLVARDNCYERGRGLKIWR